MSFYPHPHAPYYGPPMPQPYGPPPGYGPQYGYGPPPGYYDHPARVGLTAADLTPNAAALQNDEISWGKLIAAAAVSAVVFIMVGRVLK